MSRLNFYLENQVKQKEGKVDYLPFAIPKLQNYIPGLIPGVMYKITSHTGNGKTQFTKYIVFTSILSMIKQKRKLTVIYVALEESREEFVDSLFLFVVNVILKVPLQYFDMLGYSKNNLTEHQLEALAKAEQMVKKIMSYIEVVSDVYTPNGIFSKCKNIASRYGTVNDFDEFELKKEESDRQFLLVVDHISLIKDKSNSQFESIGEWHTDIAKRIISKTWNWIVVHVQQQGLDSEKQQYNSRGNTIIEKLIPSLDGLGDNRVVVRDDYVVIGLFSPARYRVSEFNEYTITGSEDYALNDNLRILYILKNRLGTPNKAIPLYFDGSCSYFCQMPNMKDPDTVSTFLKNKRDQFNKNFIM